MSEKECLNHLRSEKTKFEIVVLDLSFTSGNTEGFQLIEATRKYSPDSIIIMLTTYNSQEIISKCMLLGADDFVSKTHVDFDEILSERITTALARKKIALNQKSAGLELAASLNLRFRSDSMNEVFIKIAKIKYEPKIHTLITGQAGVGKEFIAEAISRKREGAPFYAINASCLGKDLLESELFGHEKGAFTGANRIKKGLC